MEIKLEAQQQPSEVGKEVFHRFSAFPSPLAQKQTQGPFFRFLCSSRVSTGAHCDLSCSPGLVPFWKLVVISSSLSQALPHEQLRGRPVADSMKGCEFGPVEVTEQLSCFCCASESQGEPGMDRPGVSHQPLLWLLLGGLDLVLCTCSQRELTGNKRLTGKRWRKELLKRRRSTSHPTKPPFSQR